MEKMKNEQIVTKEEAVERIQDNLEEIDCAAGRIRVSKTFFKVCAAIGAGATVIGGIGIGVLGFTLVPVATTGLGIASVVTGLAFNKDKNNEMDDMARSQQRNLQALRSIEVREAMKEEAKVKTKETNSVVAQTR